MASLDARERQRQHLINQLGQGQRPQAQPGAAPASPAHVTGSGQTISPTSVAFTGPTVGGAPTPQGAPATGPTPDMGAMGDRVAMAEAMSGPEMLPHHPMAPPMMGGGGGMVPPDSNLAQIMASLNALTAVPGMLREMPQGGASAITQRPDVTPLPTIEPIQVRQELNRVSSGQPNRRLMLQALRQR